VVDRYLIFTRANVEQAIEILRFLRCLWWCCSFLRFLREKFEFSNITPRKKRECKNAMVYPRIRGSCLYVFGPRTDLSRVIAYYYRGISATRIVNVRSPHNLLKNCHVTSLCFCVVCLGWVQFGHVALSLLVVIAQ
jgi:hypothetical protein